MLMQEGDQLAHGNVARGTPAEIGHEQVKRQFATVMLLQRLAEDDGIDGGESEIAEKLGAFVDVIGIFAAIEASQNTCHLIHDLIFRHDPFLLYPRVTTGVQSPLWRCKWIC